MSIIANKVIWSEGMLIRPQHFQQQERYLNMRMHAQPNSLAPYNYGLREISIDQDLLQQGKIAIISACGVFHDGTVFSVPDQDLLPDVMSLSANVAQTKLYLCVPLMQNGVAEVAYDEKSFNRYRQIVGSIADNSLPATEMAPIALGKLQLRLMLEDEDRSNYSCLPILAIKEVRPDKKIVLDKDFIPPLLEIAISNIINKYVEEIHGLLEHRAEMLAGRLVNSQQSESAVVADFMLLQLVNKYQVIFAEYLKGTVLHPRELYYSLLQLMAELATFTKDERRPIQHAGYQHDNLAIVFKPLVTEVRHCLSLVLEQHAVAISLEHQNHGVFVGHIQDRELFANSVMVLGVYADLPLDDLRKNFMMQTKLSSVEIIRDLVSRGIPGVPLAALAIAPRQIPYHANFAYFRIDQQHDLWQQIIKTGSVALHVSGQFPNLRLELWAIRG
jgi:type VI secretion system protein ImpJ